MNDVTLSGRSFREVEVALREYAADLDDDARADLLARVMVIMLGPRRRLSITIPKEGRAKAEHYLAFVREQPCCHCQAPPPSDPHHFGYRGLGQKTDDYRAVPLCRKCHDEFHSRPTTEEDRASIMGEMAETLVAYLRLVERR